MNNDQNNNSPINDESSNVNKLESNEETVTLHNPLKPGTDITVSKEDLENEQKYKEALTERD